MPDFEAEKLSSLLLTFLALFATTGIASTQGWEAAIDTGDTAWILVSTALVLL